MEPARLFGRPARDPRDVAPSGHEHEDGIRAVCLFLDDELDWTAFGVWLTMLLQARGEDVLRVKGLLNVGAEGPLLVNGVQHAVHPPEHLDAWPDEDRRSRIVFIGRGFDGGELERSLAVFNRLSEGHGSAGTRLTTSAARTLNGKENHMDPTMELSDDVRRALEGKNFWHLATVNPSGSPQVTTVWVHTRERQDTRQYGPRSRQAAQHRARSAGRPLLARAPRGRVSQHADPGSRRGDDRR